MPGIEKFPFELVVPVTQNPGPLHPTPTVALTTGLPLVSLSVPVRVISGLGGRVTVVVVGPEIGAEAVVGPYGDVTPDGLGVTLMFACPLLRTVKVTSPFASVDRVL